jgi:hypothetical protein
MKLPWRFLTVVLAVVAGSLLLTGCGGGRDGEELRLDEYFRQVDDIEEGIKTGIVALDEAAAGVIGEEVEATRAYFDGYQDIVGQAVNDMKDLDPPSEAGDAHDEFVAALSGMLPVWEDLSERLADLESPSGVQELLVEAGAEPAWQEAAQRFADACLDLQGIADEKGIDVELDCE